MKDTGAPGTYWQARWMRGQGASRCLRREGLARGEGAVQEVELCLCAWCVRTEVVCVCERVYLCTQELVHV